MSNVKVNGNTYNDVTSVRLTLADGSGYVIYDENIGDTEKSLLSALLSGNDIGDFSDDELVTFNFSAMGRAKIGTWSFPNVANVIGGDVYDLASDNLLLPAAVGYDSATPSIRRATITGTLDMRSYKADDGNNTSVMYFLYMSTFGTVRLDSMNNVLGSMFGYSTISNLVWAGNNLTASGIVDALNGATAITNLYIKDTIYDDVAALIADGTITKVTNLYKYSEWSDT